MYEDFYKYWNELYNEYGITSITCEPNQYLSTSVSDEAFNDFGNTIVYDGGQKASVEFNVNDKRWSNFYNALINGLSAIDGVSIKVDDALLVEEDGARKTEKYKIKHR